MKIAFLHGTETGNAEMLCEDMEAELGGGFECTIDGLGEVDPAELESEPLYVIVCSTHGNGDVPGAALPFTEALEAGKPDLSHVRFAIFGLGDMVFAETFANGSKVVMDLLVSCGATMIGERGIHDASTTEPPEDEGLPWFSAILSQVQAEAA